jgi:hypothetical protein
MPWTKKKKNNKKKKTQSSNAGNFDDYGSRQAIPSLSRFDSPAGIVQNLDFPFHDHAEQQLSSTLSPGKELNICGAAVRIQAGHRRVQNWKPGSPKYGLGDFAAHFEHPSEQGNENAHTAFIHPSRIGLIGDLPGPEKQSPSTPEMSPGVMIQPRINPFQTNLGANSNGTPSNSHVSSRYSNHSASASNSNSASFVKKEKEFDEDVALPPLVDVAAPDRSKIVVARQFLFQHELEAAGLGNEKDVSGRLMGISLIEGVRRVLRM